MLNLITNRTQSDVDALRLAFERIYNGNATDQDYSLLSQNIGSYNASDLNRVGFAIRWLSASLKQIGYGSIILAKTDWTEKDLPTNADLDDYLADVSMIRSVLPVPKDAPLVPQLPMNYEKANDVERILLLVETLVENVKKAWFYSGEIYAGET